MKMSCNGCRVLRKGCSDNCTIRPCIQWIKSSDSQANATLFLAKFYGRAGLLNLIEAGPEHLRPSIFRSLLYEACGRVVNPVYGSVGMLWSGNWAECQAAVDAVLQGSPIAEASSSALRPVFPLKTYDIRHVSKDPNPKPVDIDKVKTRTRFKRSVRKSKRQVESSSTFESWMGQSGKDDNNEEESMFSVETVEGLPVSKSTGIAGFKFGNQSEGSGNDVGLELSLALLPATLQPQL